MKALLVGLSIVAVCSSCSPRDAGSSLGSTPFSAAMPEAVGLSTERLAKLDTFLGGLSERGELGGSVAVIARHGRIAYAKAFGWADEASRTPMQMSTIMRVFSMTKPITCTAALLLVEEGRLLLTDPVAKYLPEFSDPVVIAGEQGGTIHTVPAEQAITIRMLASHTSGIGYPPEADRYPLLARRFEDANLFDPEQRLERMVDELAGMPLLHQPGTTWEYSASIDVLARVVEVVSGQPFGDFLRERIFEPLEMRDTGFTVPEAEWGRVATVHTRDEEDRLVQAPETAILVRDDFKDRRHQAGGHGLVSTAGDYARFAQMLLNGGTLEGVRILSPKGAELMRMDVLQGIQQVVRSSSIPELDENALGFGLCGSVVKEPALHTTLSSVGTYSWSGYATTHFFVDAEEDLVAVFMSQHDPINPDQVFQRFANLVYQSITD